MNAFTFVDAEGAREAAARIGPGDPRPFAGVPIAVKDNRAVAGMPLTLGSELFGGLHRRAATHSSSAGCARRGS